MKTVSSDSDMSYIWECEHFDMNCPEEKDAKECFWCFTRCITKQLFDTISEHNKSKWPLTRSKYGDIKDKFRHAIVDEAVMTPSHWTANAMLFQYGYYKAIRRYKEDGNDINSLCDDETKFNRGLLFESVSYEMNESLEDYYDYMGRGEKFKPYEEDKENGMHGDDVDKYVLKEYGDDADWCFMMYKGEIAPSYKLYKRGYGTIIEELPDFVVLDDDGNKKVGIVIVSKEDVKL